NFFYIRYWEKGPHIRLRFLLHDVNMRRILEESISSYFHGYFLKHPSYTTAERSEEYAMRGGRANNSVVFTTYEPELERYGGEAGIAISETQFWHSSIATLAIINKHSGIWNFGKAFL